MNYEVWLHARHPKTLESVATARVYVHPDRLRAEGMLENAERNFAPVVASIRTWQPGAVISTEMRMTGAALPLVAPMNGAEPRESAIAHMFGDKR